MKNIMTSPSNTDLTLPLFVANEGIVNAFSSVQVFEGIISTKDLIENFSVEANSDELDEREKMQRDVDKPRINGHIAYVREGETVYPNLTLVVNRLTTLEKKVFGSKEMVLVNIEKSRMRFICDGQGRFSGNKFVINELREAGDIEGAEKIELQTFGIKLIVTNTDIIDKTIIRGVFSNYPLFLRKPTTSLSMYFDGKSAYSKFMRKLIETTTVLDKPLESWISLNGNLKYGQAWTLFQFSQFVHICLSKSRTTLNKDLMEESTFKETLAVMQKIIPKVLSQLPLNVLLVGDEEKPNTVHKATLFGKSLFLSGLGYVVRSFINRSIASGSLDLNKFDKLSSLPLDDFTNQLWIDQRITELNTLKKKSSGSEFIIIKRSEKRIASYICESLDIYPCSELRA